MKKAGGKLVMTKSSSSAAAAAAPGHRLLLPPRPPGPVRGGGEAYTARYQGLLRDFHELAEETEAKKNRLHVEKLKKQRLLAEIKFLRRRLEFLWQNPSQTVAVKNPAMEPQTGDDRRSVHAVGSSSKAPPAPRLSPVIDLNEACELSSEETKNLKMGDVATGAADMKMAELSDVHSTKVRAGKRKISWQDQLDLRV